VSRVPVGEVVQVALVAAVITLLASALWRAGAGRGRRRPVLAPAVLDAALVASLAAVLAATLSPIEQFGTGLGARPEVNLRPLEAMHGAPEWYARINAVLLVPTVLLLAQRWRRAGIVRLTLFGVALSATIELLQLAHPERGTNVDDVLLNSAGAAAAAVVGVLLRRTTAPRTRAGPGSRAQAHPEPDHLATR
jgi:VanZ family protein